MERARQWSIRCMHEASLYERNCFITLTYDDDHLPDQNSLDYRAFQLFMKRLRKKASYLVPGKKKRKRRIYPLIRFYMCGEYGEQRERPHFHACIFNYDFDDKVIFKTSGKGTKIYTSKTLSDLWPYGYSTVAPMTQQAAQYAAMYVLKKHGGKASTWDYEHIDQETGEVTQREREFAHMSLKPGLGNAWYQKFKSEVFPHDHVIVNGLEMSPPKYYTRIHKQEDPGSYEDLQASREGRAKKHAHDNTEERLLVKETVLKARLDFKRRKSI